MTKMDNANLLGWADMLTNHTLPKRMTCNADDGAGEACGGRDFSVVLYADGVHAVCKRCDTEYTLGEVLSSANGAK